jgi:steroid 5-alpha reductase family enzyme
MWIGAFAYEVTADRQKSAWREKKEKKEHDEKFISSGEFHLYVLSLGPSMLEVGSIADRLS